MASYLHLNFPRRVRCADCAWAFAGSRQGRLLRAIGRAGAYLGPTADQSVECLGNGREGRLRLGRLLAIGTAGCLRQSAVRLPSSAQLQPNRPILVLKGCFRLGEPTRVPIPLQRTCKSLLKNTNIKGKYLIYYSSQSEHSLIIHQIPANLA